MRALLCVAGLLWLATPALAEVYKWVDEKGVVHYTDQPPEKDAKPAKLPPLQTFPGGHPPDLTAPANRTQTAEEGNKAVPAGAYSEIKILSPGPDETLRDDARTISVSVQITPALKEGHGLVYYLDGQAQNPKPLPSTSTVLNGVERGSHTVYVVCLSADGRVLARSSAVTFHMKPPVAKKMH